MKRCASSRSNNPSKPQHRVVYESILDGIRAGAYVFGEKLPTQKELSSKFDVSRPTVIRALHDLAADGFIQAKQGAGSFVKPSVLSTLKIGLILPGVDESRTDSVFGAFMHQLLHETTRIGWQILLHNASLREEYNEAHHSPVQLARRLIEMGIRAAILCPHEVAGRGDAFNHNVLSEFTAAGVAVVLIDRDIAEYPNRSKYDLVCMDNESAGELLGRHLIKQGTNRMIFMCSRAHFPTVRSRVQGLCSSLQKANIDFSNDQVCVGDLEDLDFLRRCLKLHNPDTIICDNDCAAAMVMQNLNVLKIAVPDKMMVAGFDNTPISGLLSVPLTTIAQPVSALAFKTVETLRDRMDRRDLPPCTVSIRGHLIARQSTRAHPSL